MIQPLCLPSARYVGCLSIAIIAFSIIGCEGRTGEIGAPIGLEYNHQLSEMQLSRSTPTDLQAKFGKDNVSLHEKRLEDGHQIEIWQVFRGGNVDVGQFLMWGQIAHDKDQALLFKFVDGYLVSYQSFVYSDNGEATSPYAQPKATVPELDNMGFPKKPDQSGAVTAVDPR